MATKRVLLLPALFASVALADPLGTLQTTPAQTEISDAVLERASASRTVAIGAVSTGGGVSTIPLEVYVARVLAGEAEPAAADAAQQALAVAVRTYAVVNLGRHRREGFDLCDTTHCQVLRAANDTSRRAALATAGRVLSLDGKPVEIFYSASCGGRSESAADVWPGGTKFPYLLSVPDDVHVDEVPWVLDLTLEEIRQALARVGFGGERLRDLDIEGRSSSGRVARLHLPGLRPDGIAGDPFRMAIGPRQLRSTAFSMTRKGNSVRFTGVGYGHGVGMCVIGAGRRARRGETVDAILAQYFPGLAITTLDGGTIPAAPAPPASAESSRGPVVPTKASGIVVRVPAGSLVSASELEQLATRALDSLSRVLGTSASAVTVELHASLDGFRYETGRPWWVSSAVKGTTIDLAPATLLAQRDGMEVTLRTAMAELLVSPALAERSAWVRVGAAKYFSPPVPPAAPTRPLTCPADAELTMALSAVAQRDAEFRAERCFARELARTKDWRTVQ